MLLNYGNGNYPNWMQGELSEGLLYFNYRGYIGTSQFGSGNINNANIMTDKVLSAKLSQITGRNVTLQAVR